MHLPHVIDPWERAAAVSTLALILMLPAPVDAVFVAVLSVLLMLLSSLPLLLLLIP
jgi:hypothetical protein